VVEDIISVSKFKCPHSGCHGFFSYADLRAHRGACRHAPCFCAEPGCTFAAPPPGLLRHLAADHSWPVHRVAYGKVLGFPAPLSEPRRLLLAEDDGRVFVVVVGALGAVTAVSVVCVRRTAGGPSQPQYTARLGASGPPPPGAAKGRPTRSPMETVTSSERPGEVTVDKLPWVLPVPSSYLLTGADGASKVVSLKIMINKISGD
jgi:E3 ubiquitin-protein ligase SIAH1